MAKSRANNATGAAHKKRGNPSDFKGQRLDFMTARIPAYVAASKNNKTKNAKTEGTREFWAAFFFDYWRKFPWRVPLDEEPGLHVESPPEDAEAAFQSLDLDLTEDERERKKEVQTKTSEKIKRWFSRQRPGAMGIYGNPYFSYLARMRRQEDEAPPKRKTDFQYYMRHPDYKEAVTARFEELHGNEPRATHISLRCKVARELLEQEPDDVKEQVKKGCDDEHAEEMAAYEEGGEGLPGVDEETQQVSRDKFMATVAPLLAGLRAFTGYTINLIAGRMDGDRFDVVSANAGLIDGKDWAQWDPVAYEKTLRLYANFVHAAHSTSSSSPVTLDHPVTLDAELVIAPPAAPVTLDPELATAPPAATTPPATPAPATPVLPATQAQFEGLLHMSEPPAPSNNDVDMDPPLPALPAPAPASTPPQATTPALPPPAPAAPQPTTPTPEDPLSAPVPTQESLTAALAAQEQVDGDTFGVRHMTQPLKDEILAMQDGEREGYIRRLRRMPSYELQRENNLARNRWLTTQLGLMSTAAFFGMKKKRDPTDEGRRRKKKQKGEADEWSEIESDSDSDAGGEVRGTPVRTRGKKAPTRTGDSAATGGAAAWAVKAKNILEDVNGVQMGDGWNSLLGLWWRMEEACGFSSKTKTHPTAGRPKAVGIWVKNARKGTPDINADTMEKEWWGWWTAINPKWRLRDGTLQQDGRGDWDVMRCPGQNGFLNVIVCLKWWRLKMDSASDAWNRAVADVQWVLGEMTGNEENVPPAAPPTLDVPPTPTPIPATTTNPTAPPEALPTEAATTTSNPANAANEGEVAPGIPRPRPKTRGTDPTTSAAVAGARTARKKAAQALLAASAPPEPAAEAPPPSAPEPAAEPPPSDASAPPEPAAEAHPPSDGGPETALGPAGEAAPAAAAG